MVYKLDFSRQALKDLEKIDEPAYSRIKQAIISLTTDPRPPGCKKLKGRISYRIRVGNYRIIYDISDARLLVDVITIGNRKDVYD